MHPHDLLPRHREHPERVVVAQVGLGREREVPQVIQRLQVLRPNTVGREGISIVWDIRLRRGQGLSAVVRAGKQIDPSLVLWKPRLDRLADARSDLRARRSIHGPGVPERVVYRARRSGWYYLQVKLAKPGFGPYRLTLAP